MTNVIVTVDDSLGTLLKRNKSITLNAPDAIVFSHKPVNASLSDESLESAIQTSLTEPLIDLFVEIFEIKGLRRQAVVLFLQQLFGDTVERKVTESLKVILGESQIIRTMQSIRDSFWPNGKWNSAWQMRTEEQKTRSKFEASSKMNAAIPELLGGVVGKQNAKRGAVRTCLLFQNQRLNQHLLYKILDEVVQSLFAK
jgi:sorting nexin-25